MADVHFSQISDEDKTTVCLQLLRIGGQIKIWKKGEENKEFFELVDFTERDSKLILKCKSGPSKLIEQDILINIEINGTHYFSSSRLESVKNSDNLLVLLQKDVFKCERRRNFRLRFYPQEKVYMRINMEDILKDAKPEKEPGELTKMFKQFLTKAVEEKGKDERQYIVFDLSVSGISLLCNPGEAPYFKLGQNFKRTAIVFKDKEIKIPMVRVVYTKENKGINDKVLDVRVAFQFNLLTENVEHELSKKIQNEMRNLDLRADFESFI